MFPPSSPLIVLCSSLALSRLLVGLSVSREPTARLRWLGAQVFGVFVWFRCCFIWIDFFFSFSFSFDQRAMERISPPLL
jgi:hypothetical protein